MSAMPARPEFFLSPTGNTWVVMHYFNLLRMKAVYWPEVEDGEAITNAINHHRCRIVHTCIMRGQSGDPAIHAEDDQVALVRVAEDEDGDPKLLMTWQSLDDMRKQRWKVKRPTLAVDDPSRTFTIEGDPCRVDQMHPSFAVMRWCFDIDGFPRKEWTFPLWRWQLNLATLGAVSFEMMSETYDATEDEI